MYIFALMDTLKKQEIALSALIWVAVFAAVPLIFGYYYVSGRDFVFQWQEILMTWGAMLPFLALFLCHDLAVYPFLKKQNYVTYFAVLALLLGVFGLWCFHLAGPDPRGPFNDFTPDMMPPDHPMDGPEGGHPGGGRPIKRELMLFIMGFLVILADLGMKFYFQNLRDHRRMEALRAENLSSQLELLRYQINPHFFMNTLNNIHALVDIDPESAKKAIEEFSKLMRIVLYDGNAPTIPLSKELEYLKYYVSLMKLRYPDSVDIVMDAQVSDADAVVPPLVMASFVENAFKHGISYETRSFVRVKLRLEGRQIIFKCENSLHPSQDNSLHGIGLDNVKKRLDLQYGDRYTLNIDESQKAYEVLLVIPATC